MPDIDAEQLKLILAGFVAGCWAISLIVFPPIIWWEYRRNRKRRK